MRRSGLTLFEVLAAVAVIGIVFTTLARSNIELLAREGLADRRLEASLVADAVLAEVEATAEIGGTAPEPGIEEREQDGYAVEIETTGFELALPEPGPDDRLPELFRSEARASIPDGQTLFPETLRGGALPPVRRVTVRVRWEETAGTEEILRETVLFDVASAQSLLSGLAPDDAAAGANPGAGNALGTGVDR